MMIDMHACMPSSAPEVLCLVTLLFSSRAEVDQDIAHIHLSMPAVEGTAEGSKPFAWKVPKGAERSANATCYYMGAYMNEDIKHWSPGMLKHVPASEIRDASGPMTQSVDIADSDGDPAHKPDPRPELQHVNHPRSGEEIGDTFEFHYVDPTLRQDNQKIRLVFYPKSSSEHASNGTVDLEMFGNQFKGTVERPTTVSAGSYSEYRKYFTDGYS